MLGKGKKSVTVWYPDLAFLLNSATDLLALSATARLAGLPLRWRRLLAAAALGGVYGVICLLPPTAAAGNVIVQGLMAAVLVWISFGLSAFFLRQLLLFWLLSCTLGGVLLAADALLRDRFDWELLNNLNWKVFFFVGGTSYFLLSVIFRGSARHGLQGELCRCTVELDGRQADLTALLDTGHTLTDYATGEAVLIAEAEALKCLWSGKEKAVIDQLPTQGAAWCMRRLASNRCFRLLPYQAVGVSGGLLLCFRADRAVIGKREYRHLTVAISPTPVSDGGGYSALWSGRKGRINDAA